MFSLKNVEIPSCQDSLVSQGFHGLKLCLMHQPFYIFVSVGFLFSKKEFSFLHIVAGLLCCDAPEVLWTKKHPSFLQQGGEEIIFKPFIALYVVSGT